MIQKVPINPEKKQIQTVTGQMTIILNTYTFCYMTSRYVKPKQPFIIWHLFRCCYNSDRKKKTLYFYMYIKFLRKFGIHQIGENSSVPPEGLRSHLCDLPLCPGQCLTPRGHFSNVCWHQLFAGCMWRSFYLIHTHHFYSSDRETIIICQQFGW